jgi:hypothetical protein
MMRPQISTARFERNDFMTLAGRSPAEENSILVGCDSPSRTFIATGYKAQFSRRAKVGSAGGDRGHQFRWQSIISHGLPRPAADGNIGPAAINVVLSRFESLTSQRLRHEVALAIVQPSRNVLRTVQTKPDMRSRNGLLTPCENQNQEDGKYGRWTHLFSLPPKLGRRKVLTPADRRTRHRIGPAVDVDHGKNIFARASRMNLPIPVLALFAIGSCATSIAAGSDDRKNDPFVGRWRWTFNGMIVDIRPGGNIEVSSKRVGVWKVLPTKTVERKYELTWNDGAVVDTIILDRNGKKFAGRNHNRFKFIGERVE